MIIEKFIGLKIEEETKRDSSFLSERYEIHTAI